MEETSASSAVFQPPAITPAQPIPPSENSKPFPTPFSSETENSTTNTNSTDTNTNTTSEDVNGKNSLNKVRDGRIFKRKKKPKMQMSKMKPPVINVSKDFVNAKLRRKIYPKTPVWILRELAMELNTEEVYRYLDPVEEDVDGETMTLFPCEVQINGGIFSGSAPDGEISRMLAAENAIQALTINAVNSEPP